MTSSNVGAAPTRAKHEEVRRTADTNVSVAQSRRNAALLCVGCFALAGLTYLMGQDPWPPVGLGVLSGAVTFCGDS